MNTQMSNALTTGDNTPVVLNGSSGQSEFTITSVELVDVINQFRQEEGNRSTLQHKTLLESIRTEIGVLESAGIGQQNFLPSSYINQQNKSQPCYQMNKAGVLQMLNKESAVVRYKTTRYIEQLEKQNKQICLDGLSIEMKALLTLDQRSVEQDKRISNLEDNIHITRSQQKQLKQFANEVIVSALGSKYSKAYKLFAKKAFSVFWHDFYNNFNIASYLDTPKIKFQEALQFINDWKPNTELSCMITGANLGGQENEQES